MKIFTIASAVLFSANVAFAGSCHVQEIKPEKSVLYFNNYTIEMQGPDDPETPTAWNGDIVIKSPGNEQCSISPGLTEPPFFAAGSHILYIQDYSGSEVVQGAIDMRNCDILWTSPEYVGEPKLISGGRFLYEIERKSWGDKEDKSLLVKIGADCLPEQ